MPIVGLDEAIWLVVDRQDGSNRGIALVAAPQSSLEAGGTLSFSFGEFKILGRGTSQRGYPVVAVQQGEQGPEIWDITEAREFKGRIAMAAA